MVIPSRTSSTSTNKMDQSPPNPTAGQISNRNFDYTYGRPITFDKAKTLLAAAETTAYARSLRMCLTVLDSAGNLVRFHPMDGALLMSISASQEKARTAVLMNAPSKTAEEIVGSGPAGTTYLSAGVIAVRGGIPLILDREIIGSFAASAGTLEYDEDIYWVGALALRSL
ncbi:hypothetical protein BJX64DRAFT_290544 [Aspergillus heterothallicus]